MILARDGRTENWRYSIRGPCGPKHFLCSCLLLAMMLIKWSPSRASWAGLLLLWTWPSSSSPVGQLTHKTFCQQSWPAAWPKCSLILSNLWFDPPPGQLGHKIGWPPAPAARPLQVLEPGLVNTPIKVKRANLATSNEAAAKSFDRIQHYFNLRTLVCLSLTHIIREHNWVHCSAGERIIVFLWNVTFNETQK